MIFSYHCLTVNGVTHHTPKTEESQVGILDMPEAQSLLNQSVFLWQSGIPL